jgi:hypothetical protein
MLFKDMSPPHTFGINASVGTSAERAAKPRLFAFGPTLDPSIFEIFLLRRTPAARGFEMGWIRNRMGIWIGLGDEIVGVKKPFRIFSHKRIGKTFRINNGIWKCVEWRVDEKDIWVSDLRIHADCEGIMGATAGHRRSTRGRGLGCWCVWSWVKGSSGGGEEGKVEGHCGQRTSAVLAYFTPSLLISFHDTR